jgi:class 3 adenylate cyclase/tetratricopeptide (TPR) repeat protein
MIGGEGASAALDAYAPRGLIAGASARAEPSVAHRTGFGVVLLADLCGFTRLTAELARSGRTGAEQLTDLLDRCFGPLVDQIHQCGGDVVAFAGDSALALWEEPEPVARLTRGVARCALDLIGKHRAMGSGSALFLPLRIALGAGTVRRLELGGEAGRWVHLAAGEAVEAALRADALRVADHVIVSPSAAEQLGPGFVGEWVDGHYSISAATGAIDATLGAPPSRTAPLAAPLLKAFVPEVVVQRLAAGPSQFVAEFRTVSVAFLAFDSALASDVARLQQAVVTAQRCLEQFDGFFHQLVEDDKGLTLVGAFGVPPRSHEDDPVRAVEFASALMDLFGDLGVRARAAVSTGSVFCGDYGGSTRRQYGVVGSCMNRAAHLLSRAEPGAVVCDVATQRRASRRRHFVALPELRLKGADEPVQAYLTGSTWSAAVRPDAGQQVVGRAELRAALGTYLDRLRADGDRPPLLVLEGEAGIGKTTLLSDLDRRAREAGIEVVWSQGEAIKARASYAAVRPLVRALLASAPHPGEAIPAWRPGLLSAVLPERFEPEASVEALTPQRRLEQLIELLRAWILAATRERPLLWIVEDAHWVESASQSVIRDLAGRVPRFGVVCGQRPSFSAGASFRRAAAQVLSIEPLDRAQTAQVLAARLQVPELPGALVDVIQRRAAGNPLFAEELAGALVERKDIEVAQGVCRIRASLRELEQIAAPPSLEQLITTRVDRLKPPDQLTLKAASVLGRSFERELLLRVRPDADADALDSQLERLRAAGFLDQGASDGALVFRHPLFQEITYGLLVQAQRRILHRRAAEALEPERGGERGPRLARLAFHWEQAGDPARALPLLTRAGDEALKHYANEEAIDLYERALAARQQVHAAATLDLELARIERNIGEAHTSLTRHLRARDHLRRAIHACGYAVPDGGWSMLGALARHLLHRARRRVTGRGAARLSEPERPRALEAMYAMAGIAPVELWLGNHRAYAHVALQLSNIGDVLEPSAEASGGTSSLGYLLGLTPFRRAAERDLRRALEGATAMGERELRVICAVPYGMFLSATGRPAEAIEVLRPASELGDALEGGPWKHRSRFMLAEALLLHGEFAEATTRFAEAAELSRRGEPHIVGFANALASLARLRLGDESGALALLLGADGVEGTRRNESKLPLFASLGALAEVCAVSGREPGLGADAAHEAERLAGDWLETASYFAGYFGHTGLLEWWLAALERGQSDAEAHVERGLRRMRRFARLYPATRARVRLVEGRLAAARGQRRRARRALRRAAALARRAGLRHELAEAERWSDAAPR